MSAAGSPHDAKQQASIPCPRCGTAIAPASLLRHINQQHNDRELTAGEADTLAREHKIKLVYCTTCDKALYPTSLGFHALTKEPPHPARYDKTTASRHPAGRALPARAQGPVVIAGALPAAPPLRLPAVPPAAPVAPAARAAAAAAGARKPRVLPDFVRQAQQGDDQDPAAPAAAPAPAAPAGPPPLPTPSEVALHGPLLDGPPKAVTELWTTGARIAFNNYALAANSAWREVAGAAILRLPAVGLRRARRGGPAGRRLVRARLRRLPAVLQGRAAPEPVDPAQEAAEDDAAAVAAADARAAERDPAVRHIRSLIRRAQRLLSKGRISRAAHTLKNVPLADVADPAVIDRLRALHPERHEELAALPRDAPRWAPTLEDATLRVKIRKWLSTGGAPGPSGLSEAMLIPLLDDDPAYNGLLCILRDIVNGDVGPALTNLLLSCRLIPLKKRDNGVRPIAVGEILVRLAGKIAFSLIRSAADDFFGTTQLGCGAPGGAQVAALLVQLAARARNAAVVTVDLINAFNCISRRVIYDRVLAHAPFSAVWRMARWLLATPSSLLVIQNNRLIAELASTTGVRQGCSLSPFLFSVGIHAELRDALAATRAAHGADALVGLVAILDNVTLWGTPEVARHLTNEVATRFAGRAPVPDLRFKPEADELIWLHEDAVPAPLVELAAARRAKIVRRGDTTRVLGAIVGGEPATTAAAAKELFQADHEQFIACLSEPSMPLQTCVLLMRMVLAPSVVHMLRTMPPNETADVCVFVDGKIKDVIASRFGFAQDAVPPQCFLPLRDGGLGLPRAGSTAPLAFWANVAQASALLTGPEHAPLTQSPWLAASLRLCYESRPLRAAVAAGLDSGDNPRLPASPLPATVIHFYREGAPARDARAALADAGLPSPPAHQLQHALHNPLHAATRAHLEAADATLARRLTACSGVGGSAWLSCCPTTDYTTLTDRDYRAAVRLRLGAIPVETPVANCNVCPQRPSFAAAPSHMVSCTCSMHCNGASTDGHSLAGNAMVHHLTAGGMVCHPEVSFLSADRKKRPDFMILDAVGGNFITDHTIVNPLASSRRGAVDAILERVANAKRAKYEAEAKNLGATFVPLVYSVFGHLHPTALAFLRLQMAIASEAHVKRWTGGRRSFITALLSAVSCAIQKRNGIIVHTTLQKIHSSLRRPQVPIPIP